MQFHSEITIRRPDGSLFPPIGLLHDDDDVLSGILFLQSMGRQMAWHRNGEISGLQLQVTPPPETESVGAVSGEATHHDFEELFPCLDSNGCCPEASQKP